MRPSDHNLDNAPKAPSTSRNDLLRATGALDAPSAHTPRSGGRRPVIWRLILFVVIFAAIAVAVMWFIAPDGRMVGRSFGRVVGLSDGQSDGQVVESGEVVGSPSDHLDAPQAQTPSKPADGPAEAGQPEAAAGPADPEEARRALAAYLSPSAEEVGKWFGIVRESDCVQNKDVYKSAAENTLFRYDGESDAIDAVALRSDALDGGDGAELVVPGGLVRLSRVVGAVMASDGAATGDGPSRLELLAGKVARNKGRMSAKSAEEMLSECGVRPDEFLSGQFVEKARGISDGMGAAAVAHSMGHIVLGHVRRTAGMTAEKARDREFDADAFAFLVSSDGRMQASGDISRRMFVGNVYLALVAAARDELDTASVARKRRAASSDEIDAIRAQVTLERRHPFARERLEDQLSSNEAVARRYGLDPSSISASLRAIGRPSDHQTTRPLDH